MKRLTTTQRMSELRKYVIDGKDFAMQLVNIKFYPEISDETLAFNATLVIQSPTGNAFFNCKNSGIGGCTDINPVYDSVHPERAKSYRDIEKMVDDYLHTVENTELMEFMREQGSPMTDHKCYKSLESEVNNMLAVWCDKYEL